MAARTTWLGGNVLLASLLCSLTTIAQSVLPSNGSLPVDSHLPQLMLTSTQTLPLSTKVLVDPLTGFAGINQTVAQLTQLALAGNLVLTTPNTLGKLITGDLAYINCDPENPQYNGSLDVVDLINEATVGVGGSHASPKGAIILWTNTSTFCAINASDFNYPYFYTLVDPAKAATLANSLATSAAGGSLTMIALDQTSVTTSSALGPSPTTAVAMIILYSITGIITALFLIIIVTGAVRARRNPERYGPRNVIGRPRQSRAKGIARAMLEALPIVKFGETDDAAIKPMPTEGDVELGDMPREGPDAITEVNKRVDQDSDLTKEQAAKSEHGQGEHGEEEHIKPAVEAGHEGHNHSTAKTDTNADNGLACSVCTDDFIKGQDIRVLPCGHKFHPECIDPWLLNVSGTCPLCRIDLRPAPALVSENDLSDEANTSPNPYMNDLMPPPLDMPVNANSRRRASGFGAFLTHTLNGRRVNDATPEEHIAALRRFRRSNVTNRVSGAPETIPESNTTGSGSGVVGDQSVAIGDQQQQPSRNRLSAMVERLLPPRNADLTDPAIPGTISPGPVMRLGR
ncbi:hypothetical protein MMC25_004418 [Agyrium rufum]|nr:hypothetical protein [Agyrium rufum]